MLNRENTLLVVIDLQGKLMPAMNKSAELEETVIKFFNGMNEFNIPKLVTTQYSKGLGGTAPAIAEALGDFEPIDKSSFCVMGCEEFVNKFNEVKKENIVICGVEAHICLQQSALAIKKLGHNVFVPVDCIGSRKALDYETALRRMEQAGCVLTTYESVLYEILDNAKASEFKAISKIVK